MSITSTDSQDQEPFENPELKKPDHTECLRILHLVLDEEANDEERAIFKAHLKNCMPYYEIYHVDQAIRDLLKKNCKDKKMPDELKEEIKSRIFKAAE
jgi:mycothiol system anti-sigma-R factor